MFDKVLKNQIETANATFKHIITAVKRSNKVLYFFTSDSTLNGNIFKWKTFAVREIPMKYVENTKNSGLKPFQYIFKVVYKFSRVRIVWYCRLSRNPFRNFTSRDLNKYIYMYNRIYTAVVNGYRYILFYVFHGTNTFFFTKCFVRIFSFCSNLTPCVLFMFERTSNIFTHRRNEYTLYNINTRHTSMHGGLFIVLHWFFSIGLWCFEIPLWKLV